MIPLRPSESLPRFPKISLGLVLVWVAMDLVSRLWVGPRSFFLEEFAFYPAHWRWASLVSLGLHHHLFGLLVTVLFTWVFTPQWMERAGFWFFFIITAIGSAVSLWFFAWLHPESSAPLLSSEVLVGVWMGAAMRGEIWATKSTLVIGPGWIRIFDVPSYVLLFFWFFYLLLGNLFLNQPFSGAPMLYALAFAAFLMGFLLESLRLGVQRFWLSRS